MTVTLPSTTTDSVTTTPVTFASLGLVPELCEACEKCNFKQPTPIQVESLPYAFQGHDIIALAQTGSGKTAAFALPILQALLNEPQGLFACVLAPTRELAFQISEQFDALGSTIGIRTAVIVGGIDLMTQAIALSKKPHVIVCTPGRLIEHLEKTKGFHLKQLKYLVLDEADRLLNMDFQKEIDKLLQVIPRERRTFLFSATMTSKVDKLKRACLTNPVKVEVSSKYSTADHLLQYYHFLPAKHKDTYLIYALNEHAGNTAIVFAGTCHQVQRLALILRHLGFQAIPIHGQLSQPQRLGALNQFKAGTRDILIATDVASRGLDIPSVDLVINYDVPTHSKDYIHRVGRTARAGRSGKALTLVTQYDVELYQRIEELLGKKLDEMAMNKDSVMMLNERVCEAQRMAIQELKEEARKKGGSKHGRGDVDEEEAQREMLGFQKKSAPNQHQHKKKRHG